MGFIVFILFDYKKLGIHRGDAEDAESFFFAWVGISSVLWASVR